MIYSGNRAIYFDDNNLSWALLNWISISSGYIVSGTNTYVLYIQDLAENSTGAIFEMDQTAPVISFTDPVAVWPVASDTVSIDFGTAAYSGFKLVANTGDCSGTGLTDYTWAIVYSDTSNNWDYFCAYASDSLGNTSLIYSDNTLNINTSATTVTITDNFAAGPVQTWTVSMTWANITGDIKFKIVNSWANCDNTWWEIYTGELIYNNEANNTKYICAYASGVVNWTFATGVSNGINIDITDPTVWWIVEGWIYTGSVIITYGDINLSGSATLDGNNIASGSTVSITWSHIFIVNDRAENSVTINFTINESTTPDTTPPSLTEVTPVATYTNDSTPNYTFSGDETGTISYQGDCNSTTTNASVGNNTITFNSLAEGLHTNCLISVADAAGNTWTLDVTNFTVDTIDPIVSWVINWESYTWGVVITFSDDYLNWHTIDGTTVANWITYSATGTHTLIVTDLAGNNKIVNFTINESIIPDNTNPTVSLGAPVDWFTTTGISNTFIWNWYDNVAIDSYNLYISGSSIYTGIWVSSPVTRSLTTGNYTWYVVATDTSGNTWQSSTYSFTIEDVVTPDNTNPVVELTYPTSWSLITQNSIDLQWSGSDNVAISWYNIYINGNTNYTLLNVVAESWTISNIVNWTYTWYVIATDVNWNTWQSNIFDFTISGNVNTKPILISPTSGSNIDIWNLDLTWSWSSSSGYNWQIASDTWFNNIVRSGDTTNKTVSVFNDPDFMTWLFYWRVINTETTSISDYRSVNILDLTWSVDIEVDDFEFDEEEDANVSTIYESNEITIEWLSDNVYVNARLEDNIWALFINEDMVGSEWLVKNWDKIYIELISSSDYWKRVFAKLIVWTWENEVSDKFRVETTKNIEIELSYGQKLQSMMLLEALEDVYGKNTEKLAQFLITFKSILDDKSDELKNDIDDLNNGDDDLEIFISQKAAIDYMYNLVDDYLDDMDYTGHNVYTAPNGKEYIVEYRNDKMAYTSPNFMYDKYFPTRKQFTNHIDINNQWTYNGDIWWERIMAPNGKIYYIVQYNGKWTSTTFKYGKYFDTREQLIDYISANNPIKSWDHEIDTDFDEVEYTAPNGKKYTIFKTSDAWNNGNMYSSYRFVTPKYFPTIQRVKDHIVNQNK